MEPGLIFVIPAVIAIGTLVYLIQQVTSGNAAVAELAREVKSLRSMMLGDADGRDR